MITRRTFASSLLAAPAFAQRPPRPNVIFLLTDDQRWDQMSCAGHPVLKTPNMDRIAREGMMFRNAFVVNSLCSPSRSCFLTGRYTHTTGIRDNQTDLAEVWMKQSWPALLQASGYETAYIGKFHMGNHPQPHAGFDYWAALPGQGRYVDPILNINGETRTIPGHSGQVTTDLAIEFIKKKRGKPFGMVLGFKEPHGPRVPPEHLKTLYADAEPVWPLVSDEDLRGKPKEVRDRKRGGRNDEGMREYWRCITAADEQIGRVLETLDQLKLTENTIVVFAGDNGYFHGEFGLGDKRYAYDVSLRIPLLLRYPKAVKAGSQSSHMVLNLDLCPTLLDLARVPAPKGIHGRSWRPILEGKNTPWRNEFYYEYFREGQFPTPTIQGIRTDRYKYLEYPEGDSPELYDLQSDPQEKRSLGDSPAHATVRAELRQRMQALLKASTD